MRPTTEDLYLAYRQAKVALFFEKRGVGLLDLARYENDLRANLKNLRHRFRTENWFEGVVGGTYVVPKRLRISDDSDHVTRIGVPDTQPQRPDLEVQTRLSPHPDFAVREVLYIRKFGAALETLLSEEAVGYRLNTRNGEVVPTNRWIFDYWPKAYQRFRMEPLRSAQGALRAGHDVVVLTADLASFYDTIDPSFMLDSDFVAELDTSARGAAIPFSRTEYQSATQSLLKAYERYRKDISRGFGFAKRIGIPIGALTSRLIANVALATLDTHVKQQPDVISYRRYVDDLIIVSKWEGSPWRPTKEEVLRRYVPLQSIDDAVISLDAAKLGRKFSEFRLQNRKIRVHHLAGAPGIDFADAVEADFARVLSEGRSFIDIAAVLDDGVSHLIRVNQEQGSPLRVLRDADRARLERFSLSAALRSLERVAELADPDVARRQIRATLERVGRVLDADDNWTDNLDVSFRLLKLAILSNDWESAQELIQRMDRSWATTDALRSSVGSLYSGDTPIGRDQAWPWEKLREFLHTRRLQAVCSTLQANAPSSLLWRILGDGLRVKDEFLGVIALRRRAQLLADSDLRARDHEADAGTVLDSAKKPENTWTFPELNRRPALRQRLARIRAFVAVCENLGDIAWRLPPARLFLCTRPPSYFDVARRLLYRVETRGFAPDVFLDLLETVNAVRGTEYNDPVGQYVDPTTVHVPWHDQFGDATAPATSRLILGNLPLHEEYWQGAATRVFGSTVGRPVHSLSRLLDLARVLSKATSAARYPNAEYEKPSLLVLPELALPRRWFRAVAEHVVRIGRFALVVGVEYAHDISHPFVRNQVFSVLPGPFHSVATWPWTKRHPAREESALLADLPVPLTFPAGHRRNRKRVTINSGLGRFSVLICSEIIEARQVADLVGRVELVVCPSWNQDTSSYDHLIQSAGLQLHAFVAIANNGHYSDCRAWAPYLERWRRDVCRLVERDLADVVFVDIPIGAIREFHRGHQPARGEPAWRPLPPDWPSG